MGSFLAQMAAAGVQLLVETHSDHLLNGVRIALRDRLISPEQVAIYFFTGRDDARVVRLSVSRDGGISDWPEGFFDQSEKDLAKLAGWS
jgi:predicted ATPase